MSISKSVSDAIARRAAFEVLNIEDNAEFRRISNQSYGIALKDGNDVLRLVEVKAIVRQIDEELDGAELLDFEAKDYQSAMEEKATKQAEREREKAKKIERDKKKRGEKKKA